MSSRLGLHGWSDAGYLMAGIADSDELFRVLSRVPVGVIIAVVSAISNRRVRRGVDGTSAETAKIPPQQRL